MRSFSIPLSTPGEHLDEGTYSKGQAGIVLAMSDWWRFYTTKTNYWLHQNNDSAKLWWPVQLYQASALLQFISMCIFRSLPRKSTGDNVQFSFLILFYVDQIHLNFCDYHFARYIDDFDYLDYTQ